MSDETGNHIHHALCGHGGERVIRDSNGNEVCKVDGYEPTTKTIYQYHGCKWHGCTCLPNRTNADENQYVTTKGMEKFFKGRGYNVVSVWECEKPRKKKVFFNIEFIPYPHYIVFDFESILKVLNQCQTSDLTYIAKQIPVSVGICDSLMKKPAFIVHEDPQELIRQFVMELERRQELIVKEVTELYLYPDDFEMLPEKVQKDWKRWLNQVPVIGFNSGRYDLNLIKKYFVQEISKAELKRIRYLWRKKENKYIFLTTEKFKFLDIKNFLAAGMSYDQWCKSLGCKLEKLVFPYEWLTSYDKLRSHGPVKRRDFYSSLKKKKLSRQEYKKF